MLSVPERVVFPFHRLDFILRVGSVRRRFKSCLVVFTTETTFPLFFASFFKTPSSLAQWHNPARVRFGVLRFDLDKSFLQVKCPAFQPRNFGVTPSRQIRQ